MQRLKLELGKHTPEDLFILFVVYVLGVIIGFKCGYRMGVGEIIILIGLIGVYALGCFRG